MHMFSVILVVYNVFGNSAVIPELKKWLENLEIRIIV